MAIIIVKNEGGDLEHAQVISRALKLTDIRYIHNGESDLDFCSADKLIISVGSFALPLLQELNACYSEACVYWGAHQITKDDKNILKQIASHINIIALPIGVVERNKDFLQSNFFKHISFVETIAVPTLRLSDQEILESYEQLNLQYQKINLDKHYIIVSLPGDAPDENNEWQKFNKESVKKLFDLVQYVWQKQKTVWEDITILVENGPRTGKLLGFDHKYHEDINDSVDDISKFFLSLLEQNEIAYQFYPFAFQINSNGERIAVVSAHKALIHTAIQTDAIFIVPGESTSQIGEISKYIKNPESVIVFSPSSQNDAHKLSMQHACEAGCLSVWNETEIERPISPQGCPSDSNKVAEAISGCLAKEGISDFFI